MSTFVRSWDSTKKMDDCIFCGKPVLENELAGHWERDDQRRVVHDKCRPVCARQGPEKVTIKETFVFHPELKDGDVVERMSPCWPLRGDDETVCAYHRWLETAKRGDYFA